MLKCIGVIINVLKNYTSPTQVNPSENIDSMLSNSNIRPEMLKRSVLWVAYQKGFDATRAHMVIPLIELPLQNNLSEDSISIGYHTVQKRSRTDSFLV
jgi:hypothetical protein